MSAFVLSVLVPIITDWVKSAAPAITRKAFGVSVDDQIKLENSAIERLKALATLDNPYGVPSQWVIDLRGAFRYIAAAALIVGGLALAGLAVYKRDPITLGVGIDLASAPFGFIFGERLVLSYKAGGK